ncbi:MAG: hypothetical protein LBP87_06445 [Planctomycetaceae bacterium]|jgi:predicted amidohydrolase|nr:hypothetical protein [Planctomycetaceae bacterium]
MFIDFVFFDEFGSVGIVARATIAFAGCEFLGVTNALGDSREGRLALWQVLAARTIDQGSRLSATRLAKTHEIDFFELQHFNENSLYANLDWLAKHQESIENTLYRKFMTNKNGTSVLPIL